MGKQGAGFSGAEEALLRGLNRAEGEVWRESERSISYVCIDAMDRSGEGRKLQLKVRVQSAVQLCCAGDGYSTSVCKI